ncbi:MAG: Hsp33 family molecular chaperone HslO [Lachnospiraceae bacterium]|nr:Hsp33 family molecular chaperone HslO [Lachnospiraceae bacterium]MDE7183946.1 Hsp33 family molecular chaperone HslO [Lachnospiraceae bacterium]
MKDYIVRATAANAQIRAFAMTSRALVEEARRIHDLSPVITAALGRLLTAGAMMGSMLKAETDVLTMQIHCDGPVRGLAVTADAKANVKGTALEPQVMLPPNALGKLDVGGAVGNGILSVIKDMGLKEPYVGQTQLQTGEIAEDLTYYFATSEQVPSAVGLGVLMEKNNTVRQAGGFIIQLMPFAEDETINALEEKLKAMDSVTNILDAGNTPEQLLELLLGDLGLEMNDTIPAQYYCDCTRERVERAIISIGKKAIQEMIDDGKQVEVRCQFCDKIYNFEIEDLEKMLTETKA